MLEIDHDHYSSHEINIPIEDGYCQVGRGAENIIEWPEFEKKNDRFNEDCMDVRSKNSFGE